MSKQTRMVLKQYFQTNKIPTQDQFADLIDSFINKSDENISIPANGNFGLGVQNPTANFNLGPFQGHLTGSVTGVQGQNTITGDSGTSFLTQLNVNDRISINGATYSVKLINSNQLITLNEPIGTGFTNATVYLPPSPLLLIQKADATPILFIDANGNIRFGTINSGSSFEIAGTVKATAFDGDGQKIVNVAAANIRGTLQDIQILNVSAAKITGKLSPAQLPDIQPARINGIASFYTSKANTNGTEAIALSWLTNNADELTLEYTDGENSSLLVASKAQITFNQNNFSVTPAQNTVYTLTAFKTQQVINQSQITISVYGSPAVYMKSLFNKGVLQQDAITDFCLRYHYTALTNDNLIALARVIKNSGYQIVSSFTLIPKYYTQAGNVWSDANTKLLVNAFGNNPSVNALAAQLFAASAPAVQAGKTICTAFPGLDAGLFILSMVSAGFAQNDLTLALKNQYPNIPVQNFVDIFKAVYVQDTPDSMAARNHANHVDVTSTATLVFAAFPTIDAKTLVFSLAKAGYSKDDCTTALKTIFPDLPVNVFVDAIMNAFSSTS